MAKRLYAAGLRSEHVRMIEARKVAEYGMEAGMKSADVAGER